MELSKRMRAIADVVNQAEIVADIGCDHGLIPVALMEEERAKKVYACDISNKSLQKTADLALKKGFAKSIITYVADGLEALYDHGAVDSIILAGMGGLLIRDILYKDIKIARNAGQLILAPQGNEYELRLFLYRNDFFVYDEKIVLDEGKFYQVIVAKAGNDVLREDVYLSYGYYPVIRREAIQKEFLQSKLRELELVIKNAKRGKDNEAYIKEKEMLSGQILEVLQCL